MHGIRRQWSPATSRLDKQKPGTPLRSEDAEYHFKMAGLVSSRLRMLRRRRPELHLRFLLAADVVGARPFNHFVLHLRWDYQGRRRLLTYFVIIKHSNRDAETLEEDLNILQLYQEFDESVKATRQTSEETITPTGRLLKEWFREDYRLVIITTGQVNHTNASPVKDFPFEGIFHTGEGERIFIGKTDESVWNSIADRGEEEMFHSQFLQRLCIFSQQAQMNAFDQQLSYALEDALGGSPLQEAKTLRRYTAFLEEWWTHNEGHCITEETIEMEEIIREEIHNALVDIRFEQRYYDALEKRLSGCNANYIVVHGVPQDTRCSMLRPLLEKQHPNRFVILTEKVLRYRPIVTLESLCLNLCDEVALMIDNFDGNIRTFVERILSNTKCKVRILSLEWNASVYEMLGSKVTEFNYWSERWTLSQLLLEEQERLLAESVSFQGHQMVIGELESAWPKLRNGVRGAALGALAVGDPLLLGTPLPIPDDHFIPRSILHHNTILPSVFQFSSTKDHFFLSGFPEDILKTVRDSGSAWIECATPWTIAEVTSAERTCKTTWSEWDSETCLSSLKWNAGKNMHWFMYDGMEIIWKKTDGDTRSIGKFIDKRSSKCEELPVCTHDDLRDFMEWKGETLFLAGDAGIGKTTCVKQVAHIIHEVRMLQWVVVIRINEGRILEILPDEIRRPYFFHIFKKSVGTGLQPASDTANLFLKYSVEESGNFTVIVDGIDEVGSDRKSKAIHFLEELRKELDHHGCQLWIAANFTMVNDIAHKFSCCPPFFLNSISLHDKIKYFLQRWKNTLQSDNDCSLEVRMTSLVNAIQKATSVNDLGICDSPLFMRMISEAYMNDIEILFHENLLELSSHVNKTAVCKRYVRKNLNVICYNGGVSINDLLTLNISVDDSIVKKHTLYAAMECFSEKKWLGNHFDKLQKVMIELENAFRRGEKVQTAVIKEMVDGRPMFVHHTVAEYLAAMWFLENYVSLPDTVRHLYDGLFGEVRFFFDALLSEGYMLHESALVGRVDLVEDVLTSGRQDVEDEDKGGRRALHLAAIGGHEEVVHLLLKKGANVKVRDYVRHWSPLRYADDMLRFVEDVLHPGREYIKEESLKHLKVIDELLRGGAKLTDSKRVMHKKELILRIALQKDYVHIAEEMIKRKGPVFLQKRKAGDFIRIAVSHDSSKVIAMFLRRGFNVKKYLEGGTTPLHVFAGDGDISLCVRLLKHGAAIQERTEVNEMTPLHKAAESGHESICSLLLDYGADVNFANSLGVTALHLAARFGHESVCRLLLKRGANVNVKDWNGITALRWAMRGDHYSICQLLQEYGTDARFLGTSEKSPTFRQLCSEGNMTLCRLLMDSGVEINSKDESGIPGLHWAVRSRNVKFCRALLDCGADVNATNQKKETALHWAARAFSDDMSLFLLDNGAAVDARDEGGQTVLHFAARMGRESYCQMLLLRGAEVDGVDDAGSTPLHLAAAGGHFLVCRLLLDKGADVHKADRLGDTALHKAARDGREWIVKQLIGQGAHVNVTNAAGETALHVAAHVGRARICRLLMEYGADTQVLTSGGKTAFQLAEEAGHTEVGDVLPSDRTPVTEL